MKISRIIISFCSLCIAAEGQILKKPLSTASFEHEATNLSPVNKVLAILEYLAFNVEKEALDNSNHGVAHSEWCIAESTKNVDKKAWYTTRTQTLDATVTQLKAHGGVLDVNIQNAEREKKSSISALQSGEDALETASKDFQAVEIAFRDAIAALEAAMAILDELMPKLNIKQAVPADGGFGVALLQLRAHKKITELAQYRELESVMGPTTDRFAYTHKMDQKGTWVYTTIQKMYVDLKAQASAKKKELFEEQSGREDTVQKASWAIALWTRTLTLAVYERSEVSVALARAESETAQNDFDSGEHNIVSTDLRNLCAEQKAVYTKRASDLVTEQADLKRVLGYVQKLGPLDETYYAGMRSDGAPDWAQNDRGTEEKNTWKARVDKPINDKYTTMDKFAKAGNNGASTSNFDDARLQDTYTGLYQLRSTVTAAAMSPSEQAIAYLQVQSKELKSTLLANLVRKFTSSNQVPELDAPTGNKVLPNPDGKDAVATANFFGDDKAYIKGTTAMRNDRTFAGAAVQWEGEMAEGQQGSNPYSMIHGQSMAIERTHAGQSNNGDRIFTDPFYDIKKVLLVLIAQMEEEELYDQGMNVNCGNRRTEYANSKETHATKIALLDGRIEGHNAARPVHTTSLEKLKSFRTDATEQLVEIKADQARKLADFNKIQADCGVGITAASDSVAALKVYVLNLENERLATQRKDENFITTVMGISDNKGYGQAAARFWYLDDQSACEQGGGSSALGAATTVENRMACQDNCAGSADCYHYKFSGTTCQGYQVPSTGDQFPPGSVTAQDTDGKDRDQGCFGRVGENVKSQTDAGKTNDAAAVARADLQRSSVKHPTLERRQQYNSQMPSNSNKAKRDGKLAGARMQSILVMCIDTLEVVVHDFTQMKSESKRKYDAYETLASSRQIDLERAQRELGGHITSRGETITTLDEAVSTDSAELASEQAALASVNDLDAANEKACDMAASMKDRHGRMKKEVKALQQADAILAGMQQA